MILAWSTADCARDGQTDWLTRLYEHCVNAIRSSGSLPYGEDSAIKIAVPSLDGQAAIIRYRELLPPGHNPPTGVLDWLE